MLGNYKWGKKIKVNGKWDLKKGRKRKRKRKKKFIYKRKDDFTEDNDLKTIITKIH